MDAIIILTTTLLLLATCAFALTGWDCGQGAPNVTTISLRDTAPCEAYDAAPNVTHTHVQLLQRVEHEPVEVHVCRLRVERTITRCRWFASANSGVRRGETTFFVNIIRDDCAEAIRHGQLGYAGLILRDLTVNATTRRTIEIAGKRDDDGTCTGTTFNADDRIYDNVVVSAKVEIYLATARAVASRAKNEIVLPSGTKCPYAAAQCTDADENRVYWPYQDAPVCDYSGYAVLFEGPGIKVSDAAAYNPDVYFANSTKEVQFGLTKIDEISLCGYRLFATEHPKLFVAEYPPGQGVPARRQLPVEDILIATYFNTKISYLARHMKSQFEELYRDIVLHRCRLEKGIINNALLHIHTRPDIVALTIMKRPGYLALPAGEVAHIIPCQEITCRIRHERECFQEIPVSCANASVYLKPRSHVITRTGTPADCNSILPSMFNIGDAWHQFTPDPHAAEEPQTLKPWTTPTWKYQDVKGLLESGIYSPADLERLREHTIFPAERPALLEEIARRLTDRHVPAQSASHFKNLLDKDVIEEIAESKLRSLWDGFTQFGNYSAGVMGVVMILQFIKLIADTIIRGYTLRSVYGWSAHLLGAIWSSLTHLLVTLAHTRTDETPTAPEKEDETDKDKRATDLSEIESRLQTYLSKAGANN